MLRHKELRGLDNSMPHAFYTLGEILPTNAVPANRMALQALTAVERSKAFEHIHNCSYRCAVKGNATIVVVDCLNDGVPSRNQYGILNRERLALVFYDSNEMAPETRALRKNFPAGIHQYPVNDDEAVSLCLYDEPWTSTRRHWTAETHLAQILWWLERAAIGALHQEGQPLEPFFYSSGMKLVLPPDFDTRVNNDGRPELMLFGNEISILAIWASDVKNMPLPDKRPIRSIVLNLPKIQHANIERLPPNLGRLQDILQTRGSDLLAPLKDAILAVVPSNGVTKTDEHTLLVLSIPLTRNAGSCVERLQTVAFAMNSDIYTLGVALGALIYDKGQNKYFKLVLVGEEQPGAPPNWRNEEIAPVDVVFANTLETARTFSGIDAKEADFSGVLAGVGSLGSALAETWATEGWGHWTYVDHDIVESHNVVRHSAKYSDIGLYKVHQVAQSIANNYYPGLVSPRCIPDSAVNFSNTELGKALSEANLVVDASTTLDVPREIALHDEVPRSISVFFTPNGYNSVMLAEDLNRDIRLDSLEAQYYRAILENDWGENHLDKHGGRIWVGNGCRDLSGIIPTDLVQLHSALLARRVRQARNHDCAKISVACFSDENGVVIHEIEPRASTMFRIKNWSVVVDTGTMDKLIRLRAEELPDETGGVILGIIDQAIHRIHVVSVLAAPFDSEGSCSSFVRGTDGLLNILDEAKRRTAGIVTYLGEWHSHPPKCGATPSSLDMKLLDYLSTQLATDGYPALMAIAGEDETSFILKSDL